jgi:hypothetical protein
MTALMLAVLERLQRWFKKLCVMMNLFSSKGESLCFSLLNTLGRLQCEYIGTVHIVFWVTRLWCTVVLPYTLKMENYIC